MFRCRGVVYSEGHTWVDGTDQVVEDEVELANEDVLTVKHGVGCDEQTSHGDLRVEESVTVEWTGCDESLSSVDESLSDSDQEEVSWVLGVVTSKGSEDS